MTGQDISELIGTRYNNHTNEKTLEIVIRIENSVVSDITKTHESCRNEIIKPVLELYTKIEKNNQTDNQLKSPVRVPGVTRTGPQQR